MMRNNDVLRVQVDRITRRDDRDGEVKMKLWVDVLCRNEKGDVGTCTCEELILNRYGEVRMRKE